MNFARFFIDRPVFAGVLSLLVLVAGLVSMGALPLAEYPDVAPPTVVVRANYPGANPEVIAETVAAPLEQAVNGVDGMLYLGSQSTSDGAYTLTVTFAQGVDPEMAQVEVQNRVTRALPRLPPEVQRIGVVTQKQAPSMLLVAHLVSPNDRYDLLYLSNFARMNVQDALNRLEGVEDTVVWGAGEYSLRVWLDPQRVAARGMVGSDVVAALREQNAQVAAGVTGASPGGEAPFQVSLNARGRLADIDEFEAIVVKVGERGEIVRLRDVARVELGANQYAMRSLLDNRPAVPIAIYQSADASALDVAIRVRAELDRLSKDFPDGVEYRVAYDPTLFVRASIDNVITTLFEAVLLVVIVVLLFLQSWRATLIPLAAVPVSLVGTLAAMHLLGYSLNTLSLFGLVLSIGIVVDDAIVVVENVERHIAMGKRPREAAIAAMREVTGPIIAITAVLVAVFVPTAFLGGLTGQFYSQFALTIAISTVISALNSLTLSPALAAILLPAHGAAPDRASRWLGKMSGWLFRPFNRFFERATQHYVSGVQTTLRRSGRALVLYGGLLGLTVLAFQAVPGGFVPMQDKYYLVGIVQLPQGASLDRTEALVRKMGEISLAEPGVESVVAFPGLSINGFGTSPSAAVVFTMLDPFEDRTDPSLSAFAIAGKLNEKFQVLYGEGFTAVFPPPPVAGLGNVGGFKMQIQDREGHGYVALNQALQTLMAEVSKDGRIANLFSAYSVGAPQADIEVDREKAKLKGVPLQSVYESLQLNLGSLYVNDVNLMGRVWQVNVQADAPWRADPSDISRLYARNEAGGLVPLSTLATVKLSAGPDPVSRHNGYASADLSGAPAAGVSSQEAIAMMTELANKHLPPGFTFEWTELTYQQQLDGDAGAWVFPLAVLLAFLILAAMYNSWTLPLAVMLIVPTVLLSALAGVWLVGGENNLFTQIGLIVLVGLATKNAILIVEFARQRELEGVDTRTAVLDAARLRLRPILMTSLAFVMGVVPLVLASGAGAEMRQAMGVAVFAGMIGVTAFGLFFTPLFYRLLRRRPLRQVLPVTEELHHA
ncbi:MAG: multidrug efflux RND transporter permease subunit [Lysobacteraceae bacterium]|nr:MAG: multidrug efflux RND transporter permease subunit [Xanthomonadaceae bacterium]